MPKCEVPSKDIMFQTGIEILNKILGDMMSDLRQEYITGKYTVAVAINNPQGVVKTVVCEVVKSMQLLDLKNKIDSMSFLAKTNPTCYSVLVVPFCGEKLEQECQENRIGCIDLVGNVVLDFDYVKVEKRKKDFNPYKEHKMQYETDAGMSLMQVLIEHKNKAWTSRSLAKESGVSSYTSHYVLKALESDELIKKGETGYSVFNEARMRDILNTLKERKD